MIDINSIVLLLVLSLSSVSGGFFAKLDYRSLNKWLEANLDSGTSAEMAIKQAREFWRDQPDKARGDGWKNFVELSSITDENLCSLEAASYIWLNVKNSGVDLKLKPCNQKKRVQRIIQELALKRATECESSNRSLFEKTLSSDLAMDTRAWVDGLLIELAANANVLFKKVATFDQHNQQVKDILKPSSLAAALAFKANLAKHNEVVPKDFAESDGKTPMSDDKRDDLVNLLLNLCHDFTLSRGDQLESFAHDAMILQRPTNYLGSDAAIEFMKAKMCHNLLKLNTFMLVRHFVKIQPQNSASI